MHSSVDASAVPRGPHVAPRSLRVETVRSFRRLLDLESVWNDLAERCGLDHPFLTHEWIRTWWESFGPGNELHILVVKEGNEVAAIAPLMSGRVRMYGMNLRRLGSISNFHTPRFDFLVAPGREDAYRVIWSELVSQKSRWDVVELCQLPAGTNTMEELRRLAGSAGMLAGVWRSGDSPYVVLRGAWDDYFGSLDRKHRSNLRNRLGRLRGLGAVQLEGASAEGDLGTALEEGFRLEASDWKEQAGTAISSRQDTLQFYTLLARRAAARGWLELHFLTLDGRRIAFGYTLRFKNRLFLLKQGFDRRYAPYSPFNLLCQAALREASQRGLDEYEFLGEAEPWKMEWARQSRAHCWLYVFSGSPRARILGRAKLSLIPRLKRSRLWDVLCNSIPEARATS